MAYLGFMALGGRCIVNDCRTLQRVADGYGPPGIVCRACDPCCGDLSAGLGYPDGYNPTDLPWFDGTQESVDFAGLLIENIEGLEPGNFERPVTETSGVGAFIGAGRQNAPTIVVTALLLAASCCAQEFGLAWLRKALRAPCSPGSTLGCAGEDLVFLSCEPGSPDLDCPENEDFDFEAWLAPYYRTLKGVALVDGPRVIERMPRACTECEACPLYRVQFTLAASKPCVFLDPIEILPPTSFVCGELGTDCIEWSTGEDCDPSSDGCPVATDCAVDPDCPVSVAPPTVPPITNPCVEECISVVSCRVCTDIPDGTFPSFGEGTLRVKIYAGSQPLRRVQLQVWSNPLGFPPELLSECDVCAELNISYIGAFSTLTIDGTTRTATIDCPGGATIRANPFIASGTGAPNFTYPDLDGCTGNYTVCITTGAGAAIDSYVEIEAVGREC